MSDYRRTRRDPLDASRKLDGLERALLVVVLPFAIIMYPVAWVWVKLCDIRRACARKPPRP
jgi:hypothetical protein